MRVSGWHSVMWRKEVLIMAYKKDERIVVPKFKTEADEAQWWYENRERVEDALINAMDKGTIRRGTAQRLTSEARASRNITIRMAEADLNLARKQAEEKGLPYQTYIKSVLHEALVKRERRRAG
jgi:predicted DNA binding CopG/RHH family protein